MPPHITPHPLRKVAILVASLDTSSADALLGQLSADEVSLVRRLVADLKDIDPREQREVIDDFLRADRSQGLRREPAQTPAPVPCDELPFRFLHEAQGEKLSPILEGEHPQTIALVISHMPPGQAAQTLTTLPPAVQVEVIRRLVDLDEANPETLRELEKGLHSRLAEQVRSERRRAAGVVALRRILEAADPRVKRGLLANIAHHDKQLAGQLTRDRVEFTELSQLDDAALRAVLNFADPQIVTLAMADAPAAFTERVLRLLPVADAKQLRKSLDSLGPTRLSDVEQAQRELAAIAQQLGTEGRIGLPQRPQRLSA